MSLDKKNYQSLVQEIKKLASPPPPPPGSAAPASPGSPAAPGAASGHRTDPAGSRDIVNMQKSIQKVGEAVKNSSPEFLNFMMKQYQIKIDPSTISNVGIGKAGVVPDGVWGKRTQFSLNSISHLSESLLKVSHEFGGTTRKSWSSADHNSLLKLIAAQDNKSKIEHAPKITELLDKLADFYQSYSRQVTQTNTFKKVSDPRGVVFSLGNPAPDYLVDEKGNSLLKDPAFLTQRINANLPSPSGNVATKISLMDMFDKNRFQKFLQQTLKYDEKQAQDIKLQTMILSMIRQQVQPLIKNNAPEPTPSTNPSEVM